MWFKCQCVFTLNITKLQLSQKYLLSCVALAIFILVYEMNNDCYYNKLFTRFRLLFLKPINFNLHIMFEWVLPPLVLTFIMILRPPRQHNSRPAFRQIPWILIYPHTNLFYQGHEDRRRPIPRGATIIIYLFWYHEQNMPLHKKKSNMWQQIIRKEMYESQVPTYLL